MSTNEKLLKKDYEVCKRTRNRQKLCRGKLIEGLVESTIHVYICGTPELVSYGRAQYCLTLTSSPRCYIEVKVMEDRNDVHTYFKNYVSWVERSTGKAVKRAHTDNAKELLALGLKLSCIRIQSTTLSAYSSESIGYPSV